MYEAIMIKGKHVLVTDRDLDFIKRMSRRGFINPLQRLFSENKLEQKDPKNLINLNNLVMIKDTDEEKYADTIKQWKDDREKYTAVVTRGNDIMLSERDFLLLEQRSKRIDISPVIELRDSLDGVLLVNVNHILHAYCKTLDVARVTKEVYQRIQDEKREAAE